MNILLTGAAGFIGARVAEFLLDAGHQVVGIDNINDAYDVRMKQHRLGGLEKRFGLDGRGPVGADGRGGVLPTVGGGGGAGRLLSLRADITDRVALEQAWITGASHCGGAAYDAVINLAARAGVRPSVDAGRSQGGRLFSDGAESLPD